MGCHFLLQGILLSQGRTKCASCIGRSVLYHWDTWETPYSLIFCVYNWDCVIWPHLHSLGLGVSSERKELSLFSCWVMSDSLWPHGLQHTRPPCPSPSPRVCPSTCPMIRWCHPTISSSVILFSSCPQSFPASGSFPMNRLFTSGGLSIGASAAAYILPMNIQGWFPLGLTVLISFRIDCFDLLAFQGTLKSLLQHHSLKASILQHSAFFIVQL